jgi:hypothetical protein
MKFVSLICRIIARKTIRKMVYYLRLGSVCVTEVCRVARSLPALMARGGTTHGDNVGGDSRQHGNTATRQHGNTATRQHGNTATRLSAPHGPSRGRNRQTDADRKVKMVCRKTNRRDIMTGWKNRKDNR